MICFWPVNIKIIKRKVNLVGVRRGDDLLVYRWSEDENADGLETIGVAEPFETTPKSTNSDGKIVIKMRNRIPISDQIDYFIYYRPLKQNSLQFYSVKKLVLDLNQETIESKIDLEFWIDKVNFVNQINKQVPQQIKSFNISIPVIPQIIKSILYILNTKFNNVALIDISDSLKQIDLRLNQLLFWPQRYIEWYTSDRLTTIQQAKYIGFFNTLWLIANDVIIGLTVKTIILDYKHLLSDQLHYLNIRSIEIISGNINWLLLWPIGIKLNSELANFFAELFTWMLYVWRDLLQDLYPYFPIIFSFVGWCGIFGVSMVIAVLSDLLSLITLHLQLFYTISARIYNWVLQIIDSTFNLFRGKKRNPLRHRIDAAEYDLDQLLLGSTIFTVLVFLLPTVAVFYLLFSLANVVVVFIQAVLQIILGVLNHFPLFAIMLSIKDPNRLSDGVYFQLCKPDAVERFQLKSQTVASSSVYMQLKVNQVNSRVYQLVTAQYFINTSTFLDKYKPTT
ncbi:phosphatidylinositol N-acetylglucosaminyltransferase subunit gpi1 [Boothiomyces sp. JEL0866]|nr:phosphatidylinositol N-acetylglucosaminyltransferase subunit gpi1 [Boothiomyces sp. JEL0866]